MKFQISLLFLLAVVFFDNTASYAQETVSNQQSGSNTIPDRNVDQRDWAMERLKRISGHRIGASFGAGAIPSIGESPWMSGDPGSGIAWQLEYEWLPKKPAYANIFGLPLTVTLGALYTGYRSSGNDQVQMNSNSSLWNSHMSLFVNYLGVEGTLKLLTRSDRWTLNLRYNVGAMSSSFHGTVKPQSSNYDPFSFTNTKFGFGTGFRFNVDYNISRHVTVALGITGITGFISQPLYHEDFDAYSRWPDDRDRWFTLGTWTLGVSYRF